MYLSAGTQFGSYEISALLGEGGMGQVYRAPDTKLKREVAIKILPAEFARDPDRISRFQREAEVLAALNEPSIAAIYELGETYGSRFLVLELVEGETLDERIGRPALLFMLAPYNVEHGAFVAEKLQIWSTSHFISGDFQRYDLHPDGQRLAVSSAADAESDADAGKVTFVFNFFDQLRQTMSASKR